MADSNLGNLYVPIEARTAPLEQGMKRAEAIAREGAKRIEKEAEVNIGRNRGGGLLGGAGGGMLEKGINIAAGIQVAATALSALNVGAKLFSGNMEDARQALFQMPLGLGQVARMLDDLLDGGQLQQLEESARKSAEYFAKQKAKEQRRANLMERGGARINDLGDESAMLGLEGADAARAAVNVERYKRLEQVTKDQEAQAKDGLDISEAAAIEREMIERNAAKKIAEINRKEAEEAAKIAKELADREMKIKEDQLEQLTQLRKGNDVSELERTDKVAAEKLQIENEAEAAIRKATKDGNMQLIPEIERQKALRLAGVGLTGPGSAAQLNDIARMTVGSGDAIRNAANQEPPVTKKQGETQIGVLRDMLGAITRLRFQATAN